MWVFGGKEKIHYKKEKKIKLYSPIYFYIITISRNIHKKLVVLIAFK